MPKSRWRRTKEEDLGGGMWKFEYRDDSYEPGDWCCLYSDASIHFETDGIPHVTVVHYHDTISRDLWPPELIPDVIELLERYQQFHYHPLELLADCAE